VTVEEYKPKTNTVKKFCLPESHLRREYNYDLLDERGIVRRGSYVRKKDVIVGRVYDKKDCSELSDEEGIVEQVQVFRTPSGYLMAKIVFKVRKIPERGDKFANLSAQKGTCGMVMNPEDLPFTDEGIVPDIIINPNAIPSRMTISMLLEMVIGKEGLELGELADATPFSESSTDIGSKIGETLRARGFDSMGWETMYSGTTGEPLRARIFMGTSYYQKLKHMVADKMHARAFGNVTTLTRQPLAGRSKEGGLRLGEMERDSLISQGSLQFLKERLFDMSDPFSILVCSSCGVVSNHKDECHVCHNTQLSNMQIPFAAKLMFQQLNACLIGSKYKTELI
jgi:DNA-directed RNA polymerase II subunit RPB2